MRCYLDEHLEGSGTGNHVVLVLAGTIAICMMHQLLTYFALIMFSIISFSLYSKIYSEGFSYYQSNAKNLLSTVENIEITQAPTMHERERIEES